MLPTLSHDLLDTTWANLNFRTRQKRDAFSTCAELQRRTRDVSEHSPRLPMQQLLCVPLLKKESTSSSVKQGGGTRVQL